MALTATPIPRTLALTFYGDLAIRTIRRCRRAAADADGDPRPEALPKIEAFMSAEAAAGRQSFVVVPLVAESEAWRGVGGGGGRAARNGSCRSSGSGWSTASRRRRSATRPWRASPPAELDVLVATTVVEVGIDIPNASVMLIEDAERFGLAQLHQLRGRVGRGPHRSFCILLSDAKDPGARRRLEVVKGSNDGFAIAEQDLELRGAGNLLGTRQSGLPPLRVASLFDPRHLRLAERARELAQRLVAVDPGPRGAAGARPAARRLRAA